MIENYDKNRQELLMAVYNLTQGDRQKTAKMADLGPLLGLDRNETETVALELVGDDLLEIKSLSGALALTQAGLEQAGGGSTPVSESIGLDEFIERLEHDLPSWNLSSEDRRNLEIDLATLKLQQERSPALPGVQKTVLNEMADVLKLSDGIGNILDLLASVMDALET